MKKSKPVVAQQIVEVESENISENIVSLYKELKQMWSVLQTYFTDLAKDSIRHSQLLKQDLKPRLDALAWLIRSHPFIPEEIQIKMITQFQKATDDFKNLVTGS